MVDDAPEDPPRDTTAGETVPAQDDGVYQAQLDETIRALTRAARLSRPPLRRTKVGTGVEDTEATPEQIDWAEFVTRAIAGAVADLGGIDAALGARSGSLEAEALRRLLSATVGSMATADDGQLWVHRTEPLEITLHVDELLRDRTGAWSAYEEARATINRLYEVSTRAWSEDADARHMWVYDRTASGQMVPRDPTAPEWSWDAWRAGLDPETPADVLTSVEEGLRTGAGLPPGRPGDTTTAQIPKSAEDLAEHRRLLAIYEARLISIGELEDRLEQQRLQEWAAYGQSLKTRVEALAAATPGLDVAVRVHVDITTSRPDRGRRESRRNSLEARLVETAVMDTPTPDDLPHSPLSRLGADPSAADD